MLTRDDDILKAAEEWTKSGHGVALATVLTLCILFLARQSPFLYFQF